MDTFTESDLSKYRIDEAAGIVVNEAHQRIAEIINDYDSSLYLQWIPPNQRTEDSTHHFRVVQIASDGNAYEVFRFGEEELDERLLVKIWRADQKRHDVCSDLELADQARELIKAKEWEETKAEMADFAATVVGSPLHTFKHNGVRYE